MSVGVAVLVELALVGILITALRHRDRFISRYPELRKFYDLGILAFFTGSLAKLVFIILDLKNDGTIALGPGEAALLNTTGNLLFLITVLLLMGGWVGLLNAMVERYELVPVIEFGDGGNTDPMMPGLYLCTLANCHSVVSRLLRGRAGLIVSRHPPDEVRRILRIEKTPVLWLTKVRGEGTVSPTHLEHLLQTLVDFMRKTHGPKLILLDGVENLIVENGFVPVFKFLTTLKDYAVTNETIILVPLDRRTLDEKTLGLLRREFEILDTKKLSGQ
ncbi:DUF835 domain-containing protein [Thermococcus sp. M36]|uniref:DUF835 domain-containing protein n=1 Tax=Thermococcus sp. M36 TaxID=1638261 RepID=UPI001439FFFE|nr:DUF835 domain-containing protein [Thermococcus sp. M36]NJE05302.1 DUF835 domain-containing protein [Thermococcus sp. M36]